MDCGTFKVRSKVDSRFLYMMQGEQFYRAASQGKVSERARQFVADTELNKNLLNIV